MVGGGCAGAALPGCRAIVEPAARSELGGGTASEWESVANNIRFADRDACIRGREKRSRGHISAGAAYSLRAAVANDYSQQV